MSIGSLRDTKLGKVGKHTVVVFKPTNIITNTKKKFRIATLARLCLFLVNWIGLGL